MMSSDKNQDIPSTFNGQHPNNAIGPTSTQLGPLPNDGYSVLGLANEQQIGPPTSIQPVVQHSDNASSVSSTTSSRTSSGTQFSSTFSTTSSSDSPTPLPTESSPSSNIKTTKNLGPVIGGIIGVVILVTLIAITTIILIKRRVRRRAQVARAPTINDLLQSPRATEYATLQGDLPSTKLLLLDNMSNTQIQSTPPPSSVAVESAIQRQLNLMAQRIIALEAQLENVRSPPDYVSQATD